MNYIKIYGAPRSGTNHIKYVLNDNFDNTTAFMDLLGFRQWGHPVKVDWTGRDWSIQQRKRRKNEVVKSLLSTVTDDLKEAYATGRIKYIVIVRHPYATYLSRLRKRFKGAEYEEALNQPVGVFWFALYWNAAYWNWYQQVLKISPSDSLLVKHEDLVYNFQETMSKIQRKFKLQSKFKKFRKIDKKLHPSGLDSMKNPKLEKANYDIQYDNKKVITRVLGQKALNEFKLYTDDELMGILGYTL